MGDTPENTEDLQGRAKEAVGDLTGDDKTKHEGQADQAAAGAKEKIGAAVDAVKDKVQGDE